MSFISSKVSELLERKRAAKGRKSELEGTNGGRNRHEALRNFLGRTQVAPTERTQERKFH